MEVAELTQYVPFSRLQYCPAEISRESHLAVAGDNHLVILQSSGKHLDSREAHTAPTEVSSVVLGFGEDAGRPTVVSWIDASVLCVGFQSGLLSCLDVNGEELFIFQGSTSAVQSVKISNEKEGLKIWCLYEEGLLVSVRPLSAHPFSPIRRFPSHHILISPFIPNSSFPPSHGLALNLFSILFSVAPLLPSLVICNLRFCTSTLARRSLTKQWASNCQPSRRRTTSSCM